MGMDMVVMRLKDALLDGRMQPWKAEEAALEEGVKIPDNFAIAAMARRAFVSEKSGVTFQHIALPDKPYLIEYSCPQDGSRWWLAAGDTYVYCGMCGTALEMVRDDGERYKPLVLNYIGGEEDYLSYAGEVSVGGDVNKTFQNILIWGTGIGHLGVSVGCYQLNKFGHIEVKVGKWAYAARNLAFVFDDDTMRTKARSLIEENLPRIIPQITDAQLASWGGEVDKVDILFKQHHGDRYLHCCFFTRFDQHRGHGQTSHAVGMAKNIIDDLFQQHGIDCRLSVVGMGRDGDLKPSSRNRRGRYVSAQQCIPIKDYEERLGRPIDDFLSYVELDRQGVLEEVGWGAYTGMGGEIIPAFYRTMKNNPRPFLVSTFQKVYAETRGDNLIFGVELPNVEVGITSSPEGIISPTAREAANIAGIHSAQDFAAALAAITLGGEFNFATLHVREKMYTGK